MIKEPEWKYNKTVKKKIQVLDVDEKMREVDAFDLEAGMPFVLDVTEEIDLAEIEKGRTYRITMKVYRAKATPEIEKKWAEMEKDEVLRKGIDILKGSDTDMPLFKFDLISAEPL